MAHAGAFVPTQAGHGRRTLLAAGGAAFLLMTGCAQLSSGSSAPKTSDSWSGRMSLRIESEPVQTFAALFELRGSADSGDLTLTTPIGSTLAQLHWAPGEALLKDGSKTRRFDSVDALIEA